MSRPSRCRCLAVAAGSIAGQRDPDEWYVCVKARELADLRAPRGTASRNSYYPALAEISRAATTP
jgi:hypothetical protein